MQWSAHKSIFLASTLILPEPTAYFLLNLPHFMKIFISFSWADTLSLQKLFVFSLQLDTNQPTNQPNNQQQQQQQQKLIPEDLEMTDILFYDPCLPELYKLSAGTSSVYVEQVCCSWVYTVPAPVGFTHTYIMMLLYSTACECHCSLRSVGGSTLKAQW